VTALIGTPKTAAGQEPRCSIFITQDFRQPAVTIFTSPAGFGLRPAWAPGGRNPALGPHRGRFQSAGVIFFQALTVCWGEKEKRPGSEAAPDDELFLAGFGAVPRARRPRRAARKQADQRKEENAHEAARWEGGRGNLARTQGAAGTSRASTSGPWAAQKQKLARELCRP